MSVSSGCEMESLRVFVRAYAGGDMKERDESKKRTEKTAAVSPYVVVFDTETTITPEQQLRIGMYQVRKHDEGDRIVEHGAFYADTLPKRERDTLLNWAERRSSIDGVPFQVKTREDFVRDVLYRYGYDGRGGIVGFNLPWDISRIAVAHASSNARGMQGGFSFTLAEGRPHIHVKSLGGHKALIRFSNPRQAHTPSTRRRGVDLPRFSGVFIDVHTLARAILSRSYTLGGLAQHLGVDSPKMDADYSAPLRAAFLEYTARDVQTTWECYAELVARYARHELKKTPMHKVISEASLGKAYLREMGVKPWKDVQGDFPAETLGYIMATYFGGRSEVHIRKIITPTVYCDFKSMYPTVCANMHLWRFVVSRGMDATDATEGVREFLRTATVDTMLQRSSWKELACICEVLPSDDVFPVRAEYSRGGKTIGVNRLTSEVPLWYTLADCVASKLLTGKAPNVNRALRFVPRETQNALKSVTIAGQKGYTIDPKRDDFFCRVIDLRSDAKRAMKGCEEAGESAKAGGWDSVQFNLKIIANATSYGIFAELNPEKVKRRILRVNGPLGAFDTGSDVDERPGMHFNPLLATCITSGARLMLAMAEAMGRAEGLSWVFCDTDSMAFAPGDAHKLPGNVARSNVCDVVSFGESVARIRHRFRSLWPYEGKSGDLLELESQNDPLPGVPAMLYCYAISAKRYALFNLDDTGHAVMRKVSSHGLGHLLPPYPDDATPDGIRPPAASLRDMGEGVRHWVYALWQRIVDASLRGEDSPELADIPGMRNAIASRFACVTPNVLAWFDVWNRGKTYEKQVRPFGFMLSYQSIPSGTQLGPRGVVPRSWISEWREVAKVIRSAGGLACSEETRKWPAGLRLGVCRKDGKTPRQLASKCPRFMLDTIGKEHHPNSGMFTLRFYRVLEQGYNGYLYAKEKDRTTGDAHLAQPIAPYDRDAQKAVREGGLYDRRTGHPLSAHNAIEDTFGGDATDALELYSDFLREYTRHQETKFRFAETVMVDGIDMTEAGVLLRRHVRIASAYQVSHIGKESNTWDGYDEALLGRNPPEMTDETTYGAKIAEPSALEKARDERERMKRHNHTLRVEVMKLAERYGIRAVAKAANVSPAEVSSIVNDKRSAKTDTLTRILAGRPELERMESEQENRSMQRRVALRELCGFSGNATSFLFNGETSPAELVDAIGMDRHMIAPLRDYIVGAVDALRPRLANKIDAWLGENYRGLAK